MVFFAQPRSLHHTTLSAEWQMQARILLILKNSEPKIGHKVPIWPDTLQNCLFICLFGVFLKPFFCPREGAAGRSGQRIHCQALSYIPGADGSRQFDPSFQICQTGQIWKQQIGSLENWVLEIGAPDTLCWGPIGQPGKLVSDIYWIFIANLWRGWREDCRLGYGGWGDPIVYSY